MSKNFSYEDALTPPNAGNAFSYEDAIGEKPKRTIGQAIKDTGAQLAEGVNTTLGAIPSVVAPQSKAAGFFRDNADYWRDQQSDVLKGRIAETDKRIAEAGRDGVLSQIGTAASEYWNDPAQAARLVATNLPSMAATLGTGAAAGFAAKGVAAARGLDAAGKAALAAKYGTTTAAATNAALNAGGARGEAFEDLQKSALAQGMAPEQAEQAGVSGSILPGVVGGVAGAISGKIGLEKAILGQATTGAAMRKAAGAFGAEMAGEQIEELAPKVATNYQVGRIDPGRTLTDDLGRTMVETAIGSGPGAVVAGGAAGMRKEELPPVDLGPVDPTTSPGAADPNAPVPPGAAPVEAPDLQATAPATEEAPSPIQSEAVEPAPLMPEQRMAELDERMRFIDQQAKANGWDKRLIDAREETLAELDALRGPAQTEPIAFDAPETDPARQIVKPSVAMGLDPSKGPLTAAAAMSVDSGLGQHAQFLGATGRDVQLRQTGPGITDDGSVIDVVAREVPDQQNLLPITRRLTNEQEGGARATSSQPLALPVPTNLREGLERIRAQRQEAARLAQVPPTQGANLVPQAPQAVQAIAQQQEAGNQAPVGAAATTATQPGATGGRGVQAAGVAGAPTIVEVQDNYGRTHRVRQSDLYGNADRIPTVRRNGDVVAGEEIPRSIVKDAPTVAEPPPLDPLGWNPKKLASTYDMAQMNDLHQYLLRNYSNPLVGGGPVENGKATTERFNAEGRKIHAALQQAQTTLYEQAKARRGSSNQNQAAAPDSQAQAAPASSPQGAAQGNASWAALTPEQRRRARLEHEIATGQTNNGGVVASLRPSAIEKRKQELAAMGDAGKPPSPGPAEPLSADGLAAQSQPAPATHADPGQSPEVATPAVVAQSVQKAARNEDTKPSEMRKWLVGKIDEAIAVAPEAAVDFLSFDVPGDGTFKVQNSQARLQEFRKKVLASPGFKDGGQKQAKPQQNDSILNSGGTAETIRAFLVDGDVQGAVEFAKLKGVEFTPVPPQMKMSADGKGKVKHMPASVKSSVPSVAEALTQVEAEQLNQYLTAERARQQAPAATKNVAVAETQPQGAAPAVTAAKKPRGVLAKKAEAEAKARADYFAPGNIVKGYSGHDRVVSYTPPGEDGRWSVTVRAVEKQGYSWVDKAGERERTHATPPDARELKSGPVMRAEPTRQADSGQGAMDEPAAAQDADVQPSPQDFIPAPDGGLDYGEITPEMGKAMRRQAGKIRLQHGVQNSNGTGWGLVHIEANHGKQISGLGFGSVQDFVAHVASSIQQVWQVPGNSQLLLTLKDGRKDVMYIQLEIAKEGDFYRVNSAFPVRQEDYESLKGMKKIWDGSEPTSAVTGQRPAFATAASASPESESSQGSSNARGQDASVPPTAPAAQPITRADVTAAQQQAATLIAERIDAMTAGEANTIARRFLPTMGVKPTVSKERNKAAVKDFTKVNPMAAADEFGVRLPADVRRALDAEMQGKVADGVATPANDRNAFTLQRLNRDTDQMEPVTFERGEYVRYTVGGKDQFGDIDGISQARREFSVDGLWYPFGFAYKAERPAVPKADTVPLSSVIDKVNAKNGQGLTDADLVPAQKPASKTPTIDRHNATMAAVREGKATPEQFQASFEQVVSNKDAIVAELDTMTKAQLLRDGGPFVQMRYANEKKAFVVDAVYREMVGEYALGESVTYGMGRDSYQNAVRKLVEATDADKLAQYVADRKAAAEEYAAQRAAKAAALENPQSLTDYRSLIQSHINEGKTRKEAFLMLTPEQRIQYDKLEAESTKEARESRKRAAKTEVRTAGQTTGGEIIATKHTRDGYDLFVVKLADRLSADDYKTVLASAKKLGGWYSAFRGNGAIPGFQFKDKTNAEAFLALAGGDTTAAQEQVAQRRDAFEDDRSQGAAERLNEMAGKLEESADEEINRDRKANTARRARFASAALGAARAQQAMAKTMRNIAKAIEDGRAKFLDAVRTKTQVEMLTGFVRTAKDAELRAKYDSYADQEKHKGEPPTAATADFAEFPSFTAFRSDLATLARQMLDAEGTKKLGQQLMKVADDVTDAYLEFAKGNLLSVSQFGRSGQLAEFGNKDTAEAAIRRSGLVGKAIVLPVKRGVNRVILSPSEAMNRGIWKGDGDKRITLTAEFAGDLVEAIGRRGSKQNGLSVPWQFQTAYDRRKALARIGIETPSEFRSALREFIALQETAVADKAREMELAMVGRKADGLDFFPTPSEVADQMVEAADIQPDMAVLEPSAGMGHLAERIREAGVEPDVVEMSNDRRALLEEKGFNLVASDFMDTAGQYDRIIMNPPFSNRRDAEHVRHAYSLLKPGGRIVAIMGEGVFFGNDKKAQEFREWLESVGGTSEKLPNGSFLDPSLPVTTGANARMVVIDKADSVAMFSSADAALPAKPLSLDRVNQLVQEALAGIRGAPPVEVTARPGDIGLKVPAGSVGYGVTLRSGDIYVFQSAMGSDMDVFKTVFHELFHRGVRVLVPKGQYVQTMLDLAKGDSRIQQLAIEWKNTEMGQKQKDNLRKQGYTGSELTGQYEALAIEEALAAVAEEIKAEGRLGSKPKNMTIRFLANWLAKLADLAGMKKLAAGIRAMTYNEAERFVMSAIDRSGAPVQAGRTYNLSAKQAARAGDQTQTESFKRWFAGSKVVDADGNPLRVYHGTSGDFSSFATDLVNYFSADASAASVYAEGFGKPRKGANVLPVYLSIKNPKWMPLTDSAKLTAGDLAALKADGFDGVFGWVLDTGLGGVTPIAREVGTGQRGMDKIVTEAIPLHPEQVKSAIGNRGTFDPADPDIRFRSADLRGLKASAIDQLHQTLSHPGKVSLWDKTVGTMRHLAERSPAFKPVYEAAQRFIDDVSMLGNDAADRAPRLLPRVETLADLKKKPITAADNKAVGKPLFEGTLLWARDVDGTPVTTEALNAKYRNATPDEKAQILLRTGKIQAQMLKVWHGLPVDQFNAIINNKFESTILKPGVVWTAKELHELFGLNNQQVSLYQEARGAIDRSIDMTARADMLRMMGDEYASMRDVVLEQASMQDAMVLLTDALQADARENPDQADRLMGLNNSVVKSYERAKELQDAGYAPLSRFGRYTVDVVGQDGTREYFGMFETMRDANLMAERMRREFKGAAVTQGTMSDEAYKLFQGITPESLEQFGGMLGLKTDGESAQDKAFQAYLQLAKNNHSALKRLIHRKGIAGYSEDVGRVLASFVYSNARLAAGGLNAGTLETAIEAIPKEQGELRDVAMGLRSYIQDPQEEGQAVRGMLFAQYLGGSVASALVNMTQPFQITMPWLSQYGGMGKAAKQMARALKDMGTKGLKYEPDLERALHDAVADGTVAPQEIHQLMAQARGTGSLRSGDGTRMGDARAAAANNWERVKVAWGQPFALAEQFNRRSTFIAAYRLAKEQGMAAPAEFARRAVLETQFVYSKANKMRWGRGAIGGTLMTFKTYSVSYLELMQRMWTQGGPEGKRAVAWAVAMLLLMGGAGGLPFMEDAEDLIDGAGQLMGYNISTKHWRKQLLRDTIGKELGDFVEQGISGLPGAPIDVSGRLGMGNLLPGTGLLLAKQNRERDLLEIAGPAGDLVARGFTGARKALTGDVAGAALEMSPTAVRNAVKGVDMATSGIYKDAKGYKVIDTTMDEAIAKAIGFQPRSVAEVQQSNSFMQRSKSFYIQTSNDIKAQWAQALFNKDDAALERVRERLADWNRDNPGQPIVVKMPDVWKRVREMGKDRTQRIADTAPKALRQQMREMARENG